MPVFRKTSANPSKTNRKECGFHRLARAAMSAMGTAMAEELDDKFRKKTVLELFSGGHDSATCLAWALARFARVETLGFRHGQRHAIELDCRAGLLDGMKSLRADWP